MLKTTFKERNIFYNQKIKTAFYQRLLVIIFLIMLITTYVVYEYFFFAVYIPDNSMSPNINLGDTSWFKKVDFEPDSDLRNILDRGEIVAIKTPQSFKPSIWRKVFDVPVFFLTLGWVKLKHRKVIIRRLIAYPREKMEIKNKVIYINDQLFMPEWIVSYRDVEIFPSYVTPRDNLNAEYIERNHIFVLNDSWDQVNDSRLFGHVRAEDIEGVLIYNYSSDPNE